MDLSDFEFSPLDESLLSDFLSSPDHVQVQVEKNTTKWTFEENKLFENVVAETDYNSPDFFTNIASKIPGKSLEDIKSHYEALVQDVEMIETGRVPIPDYESQVNGQRKLLVGPDKRDEGSSSRVQVKTRNGGQQRKRGVPWTENEHQLFLQGLEKYGKGDWRSISRYYVISKTPTQVASHAQKFYRRQTSSTPPDRRRPSIHDIQIVDPSIFSSVPQRGDNVRINADGAMPFASSYGLINPMINSNFNSGYMEQNPNPNPNFLPMNYNNAFPNGTDPIFNQSFGAYPPSGFASSLGNQKWA